MPSSQPRVTPAAGSMTPTSATRALPERTDRAAAPLGASRTAALPDSARAQERARVAASPVEVVAVPAQEAWALAESAQALAQAEWAGAARELSVVEPAAAARSAAARWAAAGEEVEAARPSAGAARPLPDPPWRCRPRRRRRRAAPYPPPLGLLYAAGSSPPSLQWCNVAAIGLVTNRTPVVAHRWF